MTFREKLASEYPAAVSFIFPGGCYMCPCYYDYEPIIPDDCIYLDVHRDRMSDSYKNDKCTACWDREIPGTITNVKDQTVSYAFDRSDRMLFHAGNSEVVEPGEKVDIQIRNKRPIQVKNGLIFEEDGRYLVTVTKGYITVEKCDETTEGMPG